MSDPAEKYRDKLDPTHRLATMTVPKINASRIGRRWTDGNGTEQCWTGCSEIWHLAWRIGAERQTAALARKFENRSR